MTSNAWPPPANDQYVEELYLAGEVAPPGHYRQVGAQRAVVISGYDRLPASFDGHVAAYVRVKDTWGEIKETQN